MQTATTCLHAVLVQAISRPAVGDFLTSLLEHVLHDRSPNKKTYSRAAFIPECLVEQNAWKDSGNRKEPIISRSNTRRLRLYRMMQASTSDLRNDDAIAQHKTTAHYKGWADFKAAGGVEKQEVMKLETAAWKKPLFHSHITQSVKMFSSQGR